MRNLILIAPPATGKGTISKYLEKKLGFQHISTGDILRKVVASGSETGLQVKQLMQTGQFIGDAIILPLFQKELIQIQPQLFVLDGMPRTIKQAEFLTDLFSKLGVDNYIVINIQIKEEQLIKRVTGRRICKCGASYNIYFDEFKPKIENRCDFCGENLMLREDDTIDTFKSRYQIYLQETEPLISYYQAKNLLKIIDGNLANNEILNKIEYFLGSE